MKMYQFVFESSVWISECRNCTFFAESKGCIMLNIISRVHFYHRYKKSQSYYCLLNTTRELYAQYYKKMSERQFIFLELLWYTHISRELLKYAPTEKKKNRACALKCLMCFSICSGIYYIFITMKSSLLEHSICRKLNN